MITPAEYLINPCGLLSIPYWKAKIVKIPPDMRIVHDRDYCVNSCAEYADTRYFRLSHSLKTVNVPQLSDYALKTVELSDFPTLVAVINRSYTDLQVDRTQLLRYTKTSVYAPHLWVLVQRKSTGECVGAGIADLDAELGELILEWIQVLPEYRRRGIGRAIVGELLARGKAEASFATVSGKCDDPTAPEALYRACGFTGNDVWHVLRIRR